MRKTSTLVLTVLVAIFALTIVLMSFQLKTNKAAGNEGVADITETETGSDSAAGGEIQHNPPSMDDVPDDELGDAIKRGYDLVNDTSTVLRGEAPTAEDGEKLVNELSCTSCHAGAGLDSEVSSLVGMSAVYPMYIGRSGKIVSLEDRINGCMVRSMNGTKFESNDPDLKAMVAYMTYISEGIPVGAELPWRHQNSVDDMPTPSVADGEKVYQQSCATCHAGDGSGTGSNTGPALWGDGSFNDGAGIARLTKMAGYVHNNMPVGNPGSLSDQEVADVSAFILSQDRPEFGNHEGDWPNGGRPSDSMTKERRDEIKAGTIDWEAVIGKKE
ncbi:putative bifunctional cbb3-type cytochrome c oxidase subunit II/cytochrome c [Lysinibacillus sphaericus]|nr:putative bifunctional cbb3-type cytochrome c oxidase subunit II/cytochrome c [Lysinibacillus sphaericus]